MTKSSYNIFFISLLVTNLFLFFVFLISQHFPFFALLINILSILLISIWIIDIKHSITFSKNHARDILMMITLFLCAFIIYSYKVDVITPGIQGDEVTIAKISEQVLSLPQYVPFVNVNYGHATPLLYFTGLSIKFLGKSLFAIRLQGILFGALSVAAFYMVLRLFFNKTLSVIVSFMVLFSYPLVAISRLAYEVTPSLFFQIFTVFLLYIAWKTKNIRYYTLAGLSLGAGLYTYVGFRTFALIIVGFLVYLLCKTFKQDRTIFQKLAYFLISLFIVAMPLLSYSINHTKEITARAQSLSPFNQGLPAIEIYKELQGATFRLSNLFLPNSNTDHNPDGDPNLKINPTSVSMFDFVTFLLFINGVIFLVTKNRKLFVFLFILSLSPLCNDIFSIERIPEGHYYGIGHPNTLRIAGIIPIIYFIVAFGLNRLKPFLDEHVKGFYLTTLVLISAVIMFLNWSSYFGQPFNYYVYFYNGVKMLHVVNVLNNTAVNTAYLSPSLANDDRVKYFIRNNIHIVSYIPKDPEQIMLDSKSKELIIIDPDFDGILGKALWAKIKSQPDLLNNNIHLLTSPDNKIDAFIISKTI